MEILIGYTGFVGSNLYAQHKFDQVFNSKNIKDAYGTNPDLCVYSGIRAEKFLANKDPQKDFETILDAIENIKLINPKRLVLISTVDVYKNPNGVDENTIIDTSDLHAYGSNRYYLEKWVSENIENSHIIRLPGLFGKNIKKNFIYDLINLLPSMLNESKYKELVSKNILIAAHYKIQENGFYKCEYKDNKEKEALIQAFEEIGFSALNFTDSRGIFQFYNLNYLWTHIQMAIEHQIKLLNITVEPTKASEIYRSIKDTAFVNEVSQIIPHYDVKTIHDRIFNGSNGYIIDKNHVLNDICEFVKEGKK